VVSSIGGADVPASEVYAVSQAALAEVRRIKSVAKKATKAVIEEAVLPNTFAGLGPAADDFKGATHIRDLAFGDVAEPQLKLAEEPAV
jgi:hypothetical protein